MKMTREEARDFGEGLKKAKSLRNMAMVKCPMCADMYFVAHTPAGGSEVANAAQVRQHEGTVARELAAHCRDDHSDVAECIDPISGKPISGKPISGDIGSLLETVHGEGWQR